MFLMRQRTRQVVTVAAVALALVAAGCARADDQPSAASPSPSPSVNFSVDPAHVGDRSGNPGCEVAVDRVARLRWREVQGRQLNAGLTLASGDTVHAERRGADWDLTVTAPGGTPATQRVAEIVVQWAHRGSCAHRLYRLDQPLTVYAESLAEQRGAQAFGPGDELTVTGAGALDGRLAWDVEHRSGRAYRVFADELERAGTPSGPVSYGR